MQDDLIERRYAAVLRHRFGDAKDTDGYLGRVLRSVSPAQDELAVARGSIETGEFAGDWQFMAPEDGDTPTRAWHDIDRSDDAGYAAERIGYCRGDALDCAAWFEAGRHRAPEPGFATGGERARAEWRHRVMREPCTAVARHRPGLASIERAVARAELGPTPILLGIVLNPCGELRAAWILESSRDRDVDRAAVSWARRVVMPEAVAGLGGIGMLGRLPMRVSSQPFTPAAEAAAPSE